MRKRIAEEVLLEAMLTGDPSRAIENQEAREQQDFIHSTVLPRKMGNQQIEFEAMGIIFGNPIDDLFLEAALPAGWHREPTDHSMWSKLVDNQGKKRASIFYKAAFYDRDAFMHVDED